MTALEIIVKEKKEKTGKLDIGKCGLTELPEELFELIWLKELKLSNRIWDWHKMKWIESINSGPANIFKNISIKISQLKNLKTLYIGGDYKYPWQITDISFLAKLTNLQSLDLSSNQITDISFLAKLTNLQSLYLRSNQITDITPLKDLIINKGLDISLKWNSSGIILKDNPLTAPPP